MKLPRVRFTVRRMMVAVAVAAVAVYMLKWPLWDSPRWYRRYAYHQRQADIFWNRAMAVHTCDAYACKKLLTRYRWHRNLAAEYCCAAAYAGMPPPPEYPGEPPPIDFLPP